MSIQLPAGFNGGSSIHTSPGYGPHLRNNDPTYHVNYYGQTTLPMFNSGGHRIDQVNILIDRFPNTFPDSHLGPKLYR
jgi:hypothetical protein